MDKYGCIEAFGTNIKFDSIEAIISTIKKGEISKISSTTMYLEDGTEIDISNLSVKHLDQIFTIVESYIFKN